MRFTILASGSKGNCALLEDGENAMLIDGGISPRTLETHLKINRLTFQQIKGLVLTHTHCDHWNERFLSYCKEMKIPWYLHKTHARTIYNQSPTFKAFYEAGLVQLYATDEPFETVVGWNWQPLTLCHDSSETFGFRIDIKNDNAPNFSIGYLADLGNWTKELAAKFTSLDVLALEFNHDTSLQKESKRPPFLIQRIMGNEGHLSNEQALSFIEYLKTLGVDKLPKHLVQVHLSEQCNTPEVARNSMKVFMEDDAIDMILHTAHSKKGTHPINLLGRNMLAFAGYLKTN